MPTGQFETWGKAAVRVQRWRLATVLAAAVCASLAATARAGEVDGGAIQAQLMAGDFAEAVEAAQQSNSPQRRDLWLVRIARAQHRAGAREASFRTLAGTYDDRLRASALKQVAVARGGGVEPDFQGLMDLIRGTIAPNTWVDVGGVGAIDAFAGGVYVDPQGVLNRVGGEDRVGRLSALRDEARPVPGRPGDVGKSTRLRMVSLPRLEKQVAERLAAGRPPTEAMQVLAGLNRIRYVFVYPDSGDVVLAGPAGNWRTSSEGRIVSTDTGRPVLRLDDLLVVLRHVTSGTDGRFGCSITPTQDALARTQAFLAQASSSPLKPHQTADWLMKLRDHLGKQQIEVYGIDPRTRVGRVMVEADYRMKLVGMGLEEGTAGVTSYLDSVKVAPGETPPPMNVLRWWFALNYQAVLTTTDRDGFEIRGQGVQVLSENELLTAQGGRVHTGRSDELNHQFAHGFTTHFAALAAKYPLYAELQNIFDLALVAALVREEDLPARTGWQMTCFGDADRYRVELGPAPETVETVVNHRLINKVHILAGASGGVSVDPRPLVDRGLTETDSYGLLEAERHGAAPETLAADAWWWDD